jgi:hypothetical protein
MFNCKFCNREMVKKNGLTLHEKACSVNPNPNKTINQYHKDPSWKLSDTAREKIIESNKRQVWSIERREKHSNAMRLAVKNNPESYSSSNRGRTKQIIVDGLKLQGQWEVDFYNWCKETDIHVERPTQGFPYEWNGLRTYYPDFYLPELDLFVEVKGYEIDRDRAKWQAFPHSLRIIKLKEIRAIRKNAFSL